MGPDPNVIMLDQFVRVALMTAFQASIYALAFYFAIKKALNNAHL